MSFTAVPLHNLDVGSGARIPFGDNFVIQDVPLWVRNDKHVIADINRNDRDLIRASKHALVGEYEADAIGKPVPSRKGSGVESIQEIKFQSAMLANLAIWLRQPAPVSFTVCFHALSRPVPDQTEPVILSVDSHPRLLCHPKDVQNIVTAQHLVKAGRLHAILAGVPMKNPVWEALRSVWAALTTYPPDHRYLFFWLAMESLFGPGSPQAVGNYSFSLEVADGGGNTYKKSFNMTVGIAPLTILTLFLSPAVALQPYTFTLGASGGTPPFHWSLASGSLPAWVILTSGGLLTGTPQSGDVGTTNFGLKVADSASPAQSAQINLNLTVVGVLITTTSLPSGVVGAPYPQTSLQAQGGDGSYQNWTVVSGSGSLPGNMFLDPGSGLIHGTPTSAGTFNFSVEVQDTQGSQSPAHPLSIIINPACSTNSPSNRMLKKKLG